MYRAARVSTEGLGKTFDEKLLSGLQEIETVTLFCHHSLVPFYEEHGFRAFPSQTLMHRKLSVSLEGVSTS
jgi:hypothetical protein